MGAGFYPVSEIVTVLKVYTSPSKGLDWDKHSRHHAKVCLKGPHQKELSLVHYTYKRSCNFVYSVNSGICTTFS